jgi:hypothetical protein
MTAPQNPPPPPAVLMQLLSGAWIQQTISTLAALGIADALASGPKTTAALAGELGLHERSLYRALRAAASVGVFAETGPRTFGLNPVAELLRTGTPGSMRAAATMLGREWDRRSWSAMAHTLRTGQTAHDHVFGCGAFEHLNKHPEDLAIFNQAMTDFSVGNAAAVRDAYGFEGIGTLMDVAGGHGMMLGTILAAHPAMKGVLFDQSHVVEGAAPVLNRLGVADRVRTVGGNFFESVPAGADAILMSNIIHDWDDEKSIRILKNCRAALPAGGRLLLVETPIPDGPGFHFGKWMDLQMMLLPGGAERTESEHAALLSASGFRLQRIVPTRTPTGIVEAVAV